MKAYKKMLATLDQGRLVAGSPQTMGAIRLVPLLRREAPGDLRIAERRYESCVGVVRLDGRPEESGLAYMSYVPHGFVVSHTSDGTLAALGTTLGKDKPCFVKLHHRMVKREEPDGATQRFRTLPLHLAMEGFLALSFGGPEILWSDYSEHAARHGLSPRMETSVSGAYIQGFEDALRVFEINDDQVGVMIFVADALASVFVVSHPNDYGRLHLSVLEDFFGELLANYAVLYPQAAYRSPNVAFAKATTIDDLERAVADVRRETAEEAALLTSGLFGKEVSVERIRSFSPFVLERFLPSFQLSEECHIGERIVRDDGTLEYMKTFRLSQAQIRRGHLLSTLARANWDLSAVAELFEIGRAHV